LFTGNAKPQLGRISNYTFKNRKAELGRGVPRVAIKKSSYLQEKKQYEFTGR